MTAVGAAGTVPARHVTTRQAAFIGVGAMVGAGIFSLLGTAGEVAGSAVWLAFALAGIIAALQGYSFARLGARYPSAGGLLEYVNQGFGEGHVATVTAWLVFAANIIVTAMVALSFGSYASDSVAGGSVAGVKGFAVLLVLAMTALNVAGIHVRGPGVEPRRVHRGRDPGRVRRRHDRERRPGTPRAVHVPRRTRHRVGRGAHVLRVPGLRRRHVHRPRPRRPEAAAAAGDGDRDRDRGHHLHRRVASGCSGR